MLSPSFITDWLQRPRPLTPAEQEGVDKLLREHPYFLPAHYMDAAEQYRKNPSPSPLQAMMQLYLGNWAFFHGMLQAAQQATDAAAQQQSPVQDDPASPQEPRDDSESLGAASDAFVPEGLEAAVLETHHHETSGLSSEDEAALNARPEDVPAFLQQDWSDVPEFEQEEAPDEPEPAGWDEEPELLPEPEPDFDSDPEPLPEPEYHPEQEPDPEPDPIFVPEPEEPVVPRESVIQPLYTEDYFRYEGVSVPDALPEPEPDAEPGGDLMIMRSFADWLMHFRARKEEAREEAEGRKALKAHWQKEKLAAALEEEDEEIPEAVFEMAVSSITQDEPLVSESMASVYVKQGKLDKAIEVYRRLQSVNPAKSAYFAAKIAAVEQQKSTWSS